MSKFKQLGVRNDFIKGLEANGIVTPTEVQEKTIPLLLGETGDLICQAQTGTGKTAAFGLPLLQKVNPKDSHIQALVLAPTRELAKQIAKQLFRFTKFSDKIFTEAITGGEKMDKQIAALSRPTQIVVATPGRLVELLAKGLDLDHVKILVLDEADEMLSMGFREQLEAILKETKSANERWLFSATIPRGIRRMITDFLSEDIRRIQIDKASVVNRNITHEYSLCRYDKKLELITRFIHAQRGDRGVIFCRMRSGVIELAEELSALGFSVDLLQGELSQKERDKVMRAFRKKRIQLLVCTDVAARGIDVEELGFVVHHQLPDQTEYYTHRSGRTARAGKRGVSMAFVTQDEMKKLKDIERDCSIKFTRV